MKAPDARNTADTLRGTDVNVAALQQAQADKGTEGYPSAADLDAVARELEIAEATDAAIAADPELQAQISAEQGNQSIDQVQTGFVTRDEFEVLLTRIELFNTRSGQRI